MGNQFPKRMRLRKRREFVAVQEQDGGRAVHGRMFLVLVGPRSERASKDAYAGGRIGVTVSKRVGCAVERNRIKRWVREYVRRRAGWLPAGRDVVVIAKRGAASASGFDAVAADLQRLEGRIGAC